MSRKHEPKNEIIDQIIDQLDLSRMTQDELFGKDGLARYLTSRLLNKVLHYSLCYPVYLIYLNRKKYSTIHLSFSAIHLQLKEVEIFLRDSDKLCRHVQFGESENQFNQYI